MTQIYLSDGQEIAQAWVQTCDNGHAPVQYLITTSSALCPVCAALSPTTKRADDLDEVLSDLHHRLEYIESLIETR